MKKSITFVGAFILFFGIIVSIAYGASDFGPSHSATFSPRNLTDEELKSITDSLTKIANQSNTVQWVGHLVALLIGLAGIFSLPEIIKRKFYEKADISFSIKMQSPDCLKIPMTGNGIHLYDTYYLRFSVENTGNIKLENVELAILKLYKKGSNGRYSVVNQFLPMNLKWSNYGNSIIMPSISSLFPKHCDFGHIIENPNPEQGQNQILQYLGLYGKSKTVLILDTQVTPNTGSNYLLPGEYKMKIVVTASNAKSKTYWFKVTLIDSWTTNEQQMLQNNIDITRTTAPN
jgi:hypothetical protein